MYYHVDLETGSAYKEKMFDHYEEALAYYEAHYNQWDYASLRRRELDRATLRDIWTDILTYEAE